MHTFTRVVSRLRVDLPRGALICASFLCAYAAHASVPYVPTPQIVVERMLEVGKVGPHDYVIDLGSGDGRIVVTAAKKHGARGFGVDLNPTRIAEANENARAAGVTDKVAFYERDLFDTDLSQATVVTMYLLPRVNLDLRPRILDLKPGTRIVSHDFNMGEWKAEQHEEIEAKDKYGGAGGRSDVYLWIVPAKVAGTWRSQLQIRGSAVTYEIALDQKFQVVTGTARVEGRTAAIRNAKLEGERLTFEFTTDLAGAPVTHHFSGQVDGASITGIADLSGPKLRARMDWAATRSTPAARGDGASVHAARRAAH